MIASAKRYMTAIAAAALIAVAVSACGGGGGGNGPTPPPPPPPPPPTDVDLSRATSGFMANAGTVTIEAGQSTDHGDIAFACATGGDDCEVMVMVDSGGAISATSTGGMVTAMNSDAYQRAVTPMTVDLSNVTPGFMADAGTVTIEAGQSTVHGDIEFTCTAGSDDCVVTTRVAADGTVSADSTGGMVTAMNSDVYNTRIRMTIEADSIHSATGIDLVTGNAPLVVSQITIPVEGNPHYAGVFSNVSTTEDYNSLNTRAIPWVNRAGEVHFGFTVNSGLSAPELDPLAWLGRSFSTEDISDYTEDTSHGLGSDWRAFDAKKEYAGAGALTVRIATDVHNAGTTEESGVGYGNFARNIELSNIPALPADQDWQGVDVGGGAIGSLDGVPGVFTCASGVSACWLEFGRDAGAEGYYPYANVVFTRDDNGAPEVLPAATNIQSGPKADYLVFGTWQYVPDDITAADDYEFGVFAGGGHPHLIFLDAHTNVISHATYEGSALGLYYTGRSTETPSVGSFDARVTLSADFGDQGSGYDYGKLSGTVHNIRYDGAASGLPAQLSLDETAIDPYDHVVVYYEDDGSSVAADPLEGLSAVGVVSDGQPTSSWSGAWQALFYGDGVDAEDQPTAIAGTFGATSDTDGLVGAFGARKQP